MLCIAPASLAPLLMASMAGPESEPKLMAEMLTTDFGRKADRRPRAAEHLASRGQDDAFVVVPVGDAGGRRDIGEGAVLDDDAALGCSMSLSVPKPT